MPGVFEVSGEERSGAWMVQGFNIHTRILPPLKEAGKEAGLVRDSVLIDSMSCERKNRICWDQSFSFRA